MKNTIQSFYNTNKECCTLPSDSHESPKVNKDHHDHHSHNTDAAGWKLFFPAFISLTILLIAVALDHLVVNDWFVGYLRLLVYTLAYIPVGLPVLIEAIKQMRSGDVFSEFLLMGIATLGAFAIKEYPEAVAVMLFYTIGENFQDLAVSRATSNIKSLLDQRPDSVTLVKGDSTEEVSAQDVLVNQTIRLKPGEKLALDGVLLSTSGAFDTSTLTGESKPKTIRETQVVLAGMINLNTTSLVKVTTPYQDSKLSKILQLVQESSNQKAPTELFIRKFAKIYTPIVVFLALAMCFIPYFFVQEYFFQEWLYRSLIFLVISCPCALVISIPLGYFGGVGAASKNGILIKGSNYLDVLADLKHVVTDKTGTMTHGVFKVQEVILKDSSNQSELLELVNALESHSSHPVATALAQHFGPVNPKVKFQKVEEVPGLGLKGLVNGEELLVGNFKLLDGMNINYAVDTREIVLTTIAIAYKGQYQGYITIADEIKQEAYQAIQQLNSLGVATTMLSGDKSAVVTYVAEKLKIKEAFGDLLPEDKVKKMGSIKENSTPIAFIGDGINDAPAIALSDVGIAMGGLGSDISIESADVVIQDDNPLKIPAAIRIGKKTKQIVWQNIALAFIIKAIVLVLGAGGIATMWEAVFADVGVALLAILNAIRIQKTSFTTNAK